VPFQSRVYATSSSMVSPKFVEEVQRLKRRSFGSVGRKKRTQLRSG
jgi:hypothetical protein